MSLPIAQSSWFIGTIGFGYPDWLGVFYPPGLNKKGYLSYYSRVFNCVEVDTTFYGTPRASTIERWSAETPPHFRFCPKTPKLITHEMGLSGAEGLMQEFLGQLQLLEEKLGPVLIQLPPSFSANRLDPLIKFLDGLPVGIRYAIELRSQSWYTAGDFRAGNALAEYLTDKRIAWVAVDYPGIWSTILPTAEFLYIRWIGQHGAFSKHDREQIDQTSRMNAWLAQIEHLQDPRETIFGFVNNDFSGYAAGTALKFRDLIGQPYIPPETPRQGSLF
jgi:uncharacterized protein YecE (DUF72 family)